MSTFSIELPDTVIRQIQNTGIAQQQLARVFIRMIQSYLDEPLSVAMDTDVNLSQPAKTLRDVRGSIPVSAPQDFHAIRQQVIHAHIRERRLHGK